MNEIPETHCLSLSFFTFPKTTVITSNNQGKKKIAPTKIMIKSQNSINYIVDNVECFHSSSQHLANTQS